MVLSLELLSYSLSCYGRNFLYVGSLPLLPLIRRVSSKELQREEGGSCCFFSAAGTMEVGTLLLWGLGVAVESDSTGRGEHVPSLQVLST